MNRLATVKMLEVQMVDVNEVQVWPVTISLAVEKRLNMDGTRHTLIMKRQQRREERRRAREEWDALLKRQKEAKRAQLEIQQQTAPRVLQVHNLGGGSGTLYEHSDGTVTYSRLLRFEGFSVNVRDVTGFSSRIPTEEDRRRYKDARFLQILSIKGLGTVLAEEAVPIGAAEKIEKWFRAHPEFGRASNGTPADMVSRGFSVADELAKFAALRDSGVLTEDEFNVQKARLLRG